MPSLGVSSLDLDRVVRTTRFFLRGIRAAPSRSLFGGERQPAKDVVRQRHQVGAEARQIIGQRIEASGFLERALVHVEAAIDLDLQRVQCRAPGGHNVR